VIKSLADLTGTKVFFINGLGEWDQDFFVKKHVSTPSEYTKYTQKILNVDNRDDEEIFVLYNQLHDAFDQAGGAESLPWLNLYQSMKKLEIDRSPDGTHPGPESNNQYFKLFAENLDNLL
jgi:hypothetical protein